MTKIAFIGYSSLARKIYNIVESLKDVEIISIFCIDQELIPPYIKKRVLVTNVYSEAMRGVDAVIVACHPSLHRAAAISCFEHGLPVMLESPISLNISDTEEILSSSEKLEIPLLVNNVSLFSSAFEILRDMTSSWSPIEIISESGDHNQDHNQDLSYSGSDDVAMTVSIIGNGHESSIKSIACEDGELFEINLESSDSKAKLRFGTGFQLKRKFFEIKCGNRCVRYDDLSSQKLIMDGRRIRLLPEEPLKRAVLSFHRCVTSGYIDWRFSTSMNREIMRILFSPLISEKSYAS